MNVLSFGEIIWDVYPDAQYIGEAPFNFAAHARRAYPLLLSCKKLLLIFQRCQSELFSECGNKARAVGKARTVTGIGHGYVFAQQLLGIGKPFGFNQASCRDSDVPFEHPIDGGLGDEKHVR